jgi:hypothetical protein
MVMPVADLIGKTFGALRVERRDVDRPRGAGLPSYWVCRCQCGAIKSIAQTSLKRGDSRSCGCLRAQVSTTHGLASIKKGRDPRYAVLYGMLDRCHNPNSASYDRYGGRGIKVCDRWRFGEGGLHGAQCFIADMGPRPSPKHSIERLNNDGHYEPGNCAWATALEQNRNSRRVKIGPAKATEIRAALAAGERNGALAKRYGVDRNTIAKVGNGRLWPEAST